MKNHKNNREPNLAEKVSGPAVGERRTSLKPADQSNRSFPLTELGNAERFVAQHREQIRYCPAWNKWLVWDGRRWATDEKGRIDRMAQQTVRSIATKAKSTSAELKDALQKHSKRSETRGALEALIGLARSQDGIPVAPSEFDRDPHQLNCLNGTLDLRTGKLKPHDRADLITKMAPVEYDSAAQCPVWLSFLDRIMGGDQSMVAFLQKVIGYSLTGDVTEKALFVFHGEGNNGKTTLLETVRRMLGDYAGMMEIDVLMRNAQDSAKERANAELVGKRFVTSSETEEGQRLNESRIKQLTGTGTLQGRKIYGSPFAFDPQFKLFMDANHKPVIRGDDIAIWSRIRLVSFAVSIPKQQQDRKLGEKLKAELPGILAWAIQGCLKWQREGLSSPAAVERAVEQYQTEMDVVADFIADRCVVGPEHRVPFSALYQAFTNWCSGLGEAPISDKNFAQHLTAKGYGEHRTAGARLRKGIKLVETPGAAQVDGLLGFKEASEAKKAA